MGKLFSNSNEFTEEDKLLLFGSTDYLKAFAELDNDDDGEITFQELLSFLERKGVGIQTRFLGYTRKDIRHLSDFISTLQTALSINVKRNYVEDRDANRTVGIDTDYIETNDYDLEQEDKEFLIETGARATRAFLRDFAKKHPECRRRGSAMLSKTFFESPRSLRKSEFPENNNQTSDVDRRLHNESTSTAATFVSCNSVDDSPRGSEVFSTSTSKKKPTIDDEYDLGIPGAYK